MEWHVSVDARLDRALREEDADELMGQIAGLGGSLAVDPDEWGVEALISVTADTVAAAAEEASRVVQDALRALGLTPVLTGLQVQSEEEFERELARPIFPEVVGYAEIARMGGVSRQRARQWARKASFPRPVIETEQGPLMARAAVAAWLESNPRRPGRPAMAL